MMVRQDNPVRAGMDLPRELTSVAKARMFVAAMLQIWGCEDPEQTAILLTSEIVTNAIRYASDSVGLEVSLLPEGVLRVEATDDNPAPPTLRSPLAATEGGRGMLLVDTLARRWGTRPKNGHKVVWFEVVVQSPS
jgi:anti-sigma regulatory factor (Ser/Thr protein kinase)